ncbi:MAG TPA: acyl-CoA dehydrogenase family protein, partial [Terriglobia bacterium]|nr:acyl-CoA dehydrogenase family protein [Terriglobia bacterium]
LTYAAESLSYRTGGLIDQMLEGVDPGTSEANGQILAALREYAVECSILKVVGTETLDWIVDEAVQIFGGYGFSSEYEVERAYRDQRVNRIFEGTNEINRLLITDMLLKRSMKGELGLIPAAQKLMDQILGTPSGEAWEGEGPLGDAAAILEGARKAALLVAGSAVQKYMQALAEEQEVVGVISNLVMEVYAMESALLRTRKKIGKTSVDSCRAEIDATTIFAHEAADRVEVEAKRALGRIAEGDALRAQLAVLRRFLRRTPPDVIGLKRLLAIRALELGRYPFA